MTNSMNPFFITFIFSILCYSTTQLVVYLNGPFHFFRHFRELVGKIHPQIKELLSCEYCTSTWLGFIISFLNIYFIPKTPITPFNYILFDYDFLWVKILLDGIYGAGITWFIFRLEDMITAIFNKNNR